MHATRLSSRRAQRTLDLLLSFWAVAWIVVGLVVAQEVRGLGQLSDTVGSVGRAVTSVGEVARGLPLVGSRLAGPADQVETAGRDAVASARATRNTARRVGALLGISIALIPSLPVLLLYVPGRVSAERERRALRRALDAGDSPWLEEVWRAARSSRSRTTISGRCRPIPRVICARAGMRRSRRPSSAGSASRRARHAAARRGEPLALRAGGRPPALAHRRGLDRGCGAGHGAPAEHRGVPERRAR